MYQSKFAAPALALMLAPALACSGNGTSGDNKDAAMDTPDMATMSADDMSAPATFCAGGTPTTAHDAKFVGSWAIQSKVTQSQNVPGFGVKESTITTLSFADFKLDTNNQLVMVQRDCQITSTGVPGVSTVTIPDAVPQTTPNSTALIKVCDTGGNITWQREQATVLVGCKLPNPLTDPLPTAANDPAVFDQDGDKKTAVTIQINSAFGSGEVYTVQRQRYTYTSAALPTGGAASGATIDRSEQNTVDASNPLFKSKVALTPVDAKSSFRLASISGVTTCTQLINMAKTLFP